MWVVAARVTRQLAAGQLVPPPVADGVVVVIELAPRRRVVVGMQQVSPGDLRRILAAQLVDGQPLQDPCNKTLTVPSSKE